MSFFSAVKSRVNGLSGAWLIFIGALFWSTSGAVVKSFETDPLFLSGMRSLFCGLALCFVIRPRQMRFDRWLLLLILFYSGMVICAMTSFRLTSATMVIAVQYSAPIWLFLLNWLVTKKPQLGRVPVMLLILVAIAIFLLEPNDKATNAGNLLALGMGPLFAGFSTCMKKVTCQPALGLIGAMNLGAALILLPLALLIPGVNTHLNGGDLLYILYLAIFPLSIGYCFYLLGLKKVTPQKATLLAVWELVLTPLWAFLAVREIPSLFVAAGAVLLVVALFLDNRADRQFQVAETGSK